MLEIRNAVTWEGARETVRLPSVENRSIDASSLTLLPALIDPHVHFRVPGDEHKETWESGAKAALAGGVTTVLDMPNNRPSCSTLARLRDKKRLIEAQLKKADIPLRYGLYLGADRSHLDEIAKAKSECVALKIYMGASTGDLLIDDDASLRRAFEIAAEHDVLVAVHAETEQLIQLNRAKYAGSDAALHSKIRNPEVAANAARIAIDMAKQCRARLYIVHVSTEAELSLIREAKRDGLQVYAEAAPHHLFLDLDAYKALGTMALVNPPLRDKSDREALWKAIADGTIDTIGTDHAPHTVEEKKRPFGSAPSGFPSIELYLPLLLTAYSEGKLTLAKIVSLTHTRPRDIFRLAPNEDRILVDLQQQKTVEDGMLHTKAHWSPYAGKILTGWPRYAILRNRLYDLEALQ